jgi:hypothetical protein
MNGRQERLAQNQQNFRYANERLQDVVGEANLDGQVVSFLCECADESCLGRIDLTLADYDEAHLLSDSYIILRGHPRIEDEEIAEERGTYEIVQKGRNG